MTLNKWAVRKRAGGWRIFDPAGEWHDTQPTLKQAHLDATRYAIMLELFKPNGLRCYNALWSLAAKAIGDITRIRDIHERYADDDWAICAECGVTWPCVTIAALDGEL